MRNAFDRQLDELNLDLIRMAALAEESIDKAVGGLARKDSQLARAAIACTKQIDDMERQIERRCLTLLLQQQPVARDLRMISTALKMITDLERIGDQAGDISEIALRLSGEEYIKELIDIPKMGEKASRMVKMGIYSYVHQDVQTAEEVVDSDDEVDALFLRVKSDLADLIVKNRGNADQALELMMISKYLERIADHAVNIALWAIFCVTGEHRRESDAGTVYANPEYKNPKKSSEKL